MSQSITQAFIQQFNRNVYILSQQYGSKLRELVRVQPVNAKKAFFDRLAPTMPVQKLTRHQDTPLVENVSSRRAVGLKDWVLADLVDREDEIRLLINPSSLYAQNFARGMGRQIDSAIVGAFTNQAEEGQFGGSFVTFPTGNTLASNGVGLTLERIRQVKATFDSADVREEDRVFVVSSQGMQSLLQNTEVTNSDYNTVKALVDGTIEGNTWMGFQWVRLSDTLLPLNRRGTDDPKDRSCFAFQKMAMGLALGKDITTEMNLRPDKMNALQVMTTATFDALRIEDVAVLEVLIREV